MGNCLKCCKEPEQSASDPSAQNRNKEEMPEARLYSAPSHAPASSAPLETLLSNGNHLSTPTESSSATAISRFYPPTRRATIRSAPAMGISESKPSDLKVKIGHIIYSFEVVKLRYNYPGSNSKNLVVKEIKQINLDKIVLKQSKIVKKLEEIIQTAWLAALFDHYKDELEDSILAEGIDQFCKDLNVPPDDFKILVLAWKLSAEQMCRFTRTEFVTGLKNIKCDSIKALQARLPELVEEVDQDDELYKDLYRFAFKFGLDVVAGQRILPTSMAVILWKLVFTVKEPPILNRWLNFLETHPLIRGIPKDTWNMFLNFSEHVGNDLSGYDDNEAWPSLFDDFVEFENDQANQNISKDKEREEFVIKD